MRRTGIVWALSALALLSLSCGKSAPAIQAPSDLQVVGFSASSISLSWTDNSDNEDGFRIYCRTDSTSFALIGTNTLPSYNDSTVVTGTLYYYRVTAYNATDESSASNTVSATAEDYYVDLLTPDGGQDLTLGTMYNITWDTNMSGFDARILLSVDGGSTFPYVIMPSWAPNGSPWQWQVGYRDISGDPLTPPVWEQVVFTTDADCVIYIRDYDTGSVNDESTSTFTITVP